VERYAALRDEGVVDDPLHVERPGRNATYIGIARHVVHVVGGVGADQGGTKGRQPEWRLKALELLRRDQIGDPSRIDPLAPLEIRCGGGAQLADQLRQPAAERG